MTALRFVEQELRRRLADQPNTGTFYAWYDEQAGQLRCSLTSAAPSRLPFGGALRSALNLRICHIKVRW
ncbi:hypothetical protein Cci01nite_80970 [Catellatospora citrea]|uniref:Uncharacterized protein n=1 Tax=Catellatospora citrea TaxID=53366 RepID=A0A8J3P450_9ACTN|nr:hypothetical protein Cci01nite_80970 [Catellatospora citrea]